MDGGATSTAPRARIGEILRRQHALPADRLRAALKAQHETGARLGEVLVARGWANESSVTDALARQAGIGRIAVRAADLDPDRVSTRELPVLLHRRIAPLRDGESAACFAAADVGEARLGLLELDPPQPDARLLMADPAHLEAAMLDRFGPALAERAATRAPAALSARSPTPRRQRAGLVLLIATVILGLTAIPGPAAMTLVAVLIGLKAMNAVVRIAVLGVALRAPRDSALRATRTPPGTTSLAEHRPLPMVSLLVPLLREPEVLPLLFEALEALDWPAERLEVLLILEADDTTTREAIDTLGCPRFCRVLSAPPGGPRTKPRALNLALDFARGDVIGLYDAEDRPEPDQLRRVTAILRESGPEVACVQARLAYYNPAENWLTRCFAIEYAMWFDVLITGFRELRLPIPLGGTSVFFRRSALEAVGGWDAHNVTEDADLGMRLARAGYRCEVSASTTFEEANSRLGPWIRQRSRWLKGYMTTWLVNMRAPLRLWRDLGPLGFFGFQALFLGAAVAYLGLPVFWSLWFAVLLGGGPVWLAETPLWVFGLVAVVQLSGWLAMLCAAVFATAWRRQFWLQPWIPTLLLYWPIGALAAYVALAEMLTAPSLWHKTRHGVGRAAASELARARAARRETGERRAG